MKPLPPRLVKPQRFIIPIDLAIEVLVLHGKFKAWVEAQIAKGDPGPVFVVNGVMSTEMAGEAP